MTTLPALMVQTKYRHFCLARLGGRGSRSFEATNQITLYKICCLRSLYFGQILIRVSLLDVDTLKYNLLRFALWNLDAYLFNCDLWLALCPPVRGRWGSHHLIHRWQPGQVPRWPAPVLKLYKLFLPHTTVGLHLLGPVPKYAASPIMQSLFYPHLCLSLFKFDCTCKYIFSFTSSNFLTVSWPLSSEFLSRYINWAFKVKSLRSSTVSAYISALKVIGVWMVQQILSPLIRGAEILEIYSSMARSSRRVFSLQAH